MNIGGGRYLFNTVVLFPWGLCPEVGLLVLYCSFIVNLGGNLHTVLQSGCTSLQSHQQRVRGPFSPHPRQHLCFLSFWWKRWLWRCLIVVLICLFLIMSDVWVPFGLPVGHLYVFFEKNVYSGDLATFQLGYLLIFLILLSLFLCYSVVSVPYIFWILISSQINDL